MKKIKKDRIEVMYRYLTLSYNELMVRLQDCMNGLPPEIDRSTVTFEIDTEMYPYDDMEYPKLFMNFERLENDKEEQAREKHEADMKKYREERDHAEWKRLKKEFGDK